MRGRAPGRILTGTASWTDPGFVADWYPPDLPGSQRLRWYAEHFDLVEVNSTFYRVPEPGPVKRWAAETPAGFVFDVKLHRLLSRHSTKPELLPASLRAQAEVVKNRVTITPKLEKAVTQAFLRGIEPLKEENKLGALLLQLSPAFGPRQNHLSELDNLVELLQDYELAIELRNRDWLSEHRAGETKKYFVQRNLTFVMVDGPDPSHFMVLPSVDLISNPRMAYLRAHGRNIEGYIRGRTVATRFDHVYSQSELKEIAGRAQQAAEQVKDVHVIFNNNKADYAPRAAIQLQGLLSGEETEAKERHSGRSRKAVRGLAPAQARKKSVNSPSKAYA
jgi:uncharacterized protein YecE (DUF72 family)